MPEDNKQGVWADLPLTSKLQKKKFKQANELLEELQSIGVQIDAATDRKEEINTLLEAIQKEADLPGLRFGGLCFRSVPNLPGKRLDQTLLKTELIERGVDPEVISESITAATKETKVNKPTKCEFREIPL